MLILVPLAGVAKDSNGITNIGHSFLFVLLRYRMVIWEADPSRIYVIAKMWLIATHFLKWKWRNHIPVWLCCVVLKSGFFYVSIKPGLLMESDYFQVLKMLVLYRSSGKVQNKMLFSPDSSNSVLLYMYTHHWCILRGNPDRLCYFVWHEPLFHYHVWTFGKKSIIPGTLHKTYVQTLDIKVFQLQNIVVVSNTDNQYRPIRMLEQCGCVTKRRTERIKLLSLP